jgi:hypothetical protein
MGASTGNQEEGKRPDPADFAGEEDEADEDFESVSDGFKEDLADGGEVRGVGAHEGDGFGVGAGVGGAGGVHGFGVNEANESAVGDEAEAVDAVLGCGGYELLVVLGVVGGGIRGRGVGWGDKPQGRRR